MEEESLNVFNRKAQVSDMVPCLERPADYLIGQLRERLQAKLSIGSTEFW